MARRRHLASVKQSAEPVQVDTFAARLSDKALHCRELGHVWRPLAASWDPDARAFDRRLRCASCRTERVQVLTARGAVVSNRYVYATGYLASHVEGGVAGRRDVFRLEAIIRTLDDADIKRVRKAVSE
jgi:hypothetical protein